MKFQEIWHVGPIFWILEAQKPWYSLGKTMIWARDRPSTPLLAKFTENKRISPFLLVLGGNSPKRAKKVISCDFCDFRSGRTPSGPMNLLCFSMVWGASGRPGARRCAFSTFYVKIMKPHKNLEIHEIVWNFMKFHEIHEIYGNSWFLWIWRLQNLDIP